MFSPPFSCCCCSCCSNFVCSNVCFSDQRKPIEDEIKEIKAKRAYVIANTDVHDEETYDKKIKIKPIKAPAAAKPTGKALSRFQIFKASKGL